MFATSHNAPAQPGQFKRWQIEDGLPQNSVKHILQTKDGYIWLATHGGLARFDGVKFKVFDVSTTPELTSNRIITLFEDSRGRLFIGTSGGGLVVYERNRFRNISKVLGVNHQVTLRITEDSHNKIWVVTGESGVKVLDGKTLSPLKGYESLDGIQCRYIYEIPGGEMILEDGYLSQVWNNGALQDPTHYDYRKIAYPTVTSLYDNKKNTLWIGGFGMLCKMVNHRIVKEYKVPGTLQPQGYIYRMFQLEEGQLSLAFNNSDRLMLFNTGTEQFSVDTFNLECEGAEIEHVTKDRENTLWYGTSTCGLVKRNSFQIEYIDTDPTITNHNYYPIMKDSHGKIFIGTNSSGLYVMENGKSIEHPVREGIPPYGFPYSIVELNEDEYYTICNGYSYLFKTRNGKPTHIPNPGKGDINFLALYKDKSGELFASATNGLFQLQQDKLVPHHLLNRLHGEIIHIFFEDSKDNLWLLGSNSIFCYNKVNKAFKEFTSGKDFKTRFFRGASEDREGRLYFGSYGHGLLTYDGTSFSGITLSDGLIENVVSSITEDERGHIWLTGNKGLTRLRREDLHAFLDHKSTRVNPILFDRSDGFRNAEFNGPVQQSKCKVGDDTYLFPTIDGCVKIDFSTIHDNTIPPPVIIEAIITEDSTYLPYTKSSIPYGEGRMEFTYTALSFASVKNIKFKYKLEGYDSDWKDGGTERKTSYTKIAPGDYTFRVIACNSDGVWNMAGSSASFTIVPLFYMTWWFRTILVMIVGFLLSLVAVLIDRRSKKQEHEKAILMDVLPDMILKVNSQGRYLDVFGNPAALVKPFSEIKGRTVWDILPSGFSDQVFEKITTTLATKKMQLMEYQLQRMDGKYREYEGRFVYVDKKEVLYIIRDITDTKEAERRIRESEQKLTVALEEEKKLKQILKQQQKQELKSIVKVEERERKRIATDLHDSVGQLLTNVKINLGILSEKQEAFSNQEQRLLDNSKKSIQDITHEIRNISYNLMPSSLDQFGLISAIEEEIKNISVSKDLAIQFIHTTVEDRFVTEVELALYRVFQEIVNNVIKHSGATELVIQLIQHGSTLQLIAEDNGKGFLVEAGLDKKDSNGLKNLRSRVIVLNGKMSIDSMPGRGTTIIIEIPLKDKESDSP